MSRQTILWESADLPERKRLLLRALLEEEGLSAPAENRIERASGGGPGPLSFAQERLWFLDQLHPGRSVYNLPFQVGIEGSLDVECLRRALDAIVERHEALRVVFVERDGRPEQAPGPRRELALPITDLSEAPEPIRNGDVSRLGREEASRPFHLATGPLLRARLVRLSVERHVLLLTFHHIVADGWSMAIFCRELSALYTAFTEGASSSLPSLPIQYGDFARWQREHLASGAFDEDRAYWKRQLAGAPAVLQLPADRARPADRSQRGGTVTAILPPDLEDAIRTLSLQEEATSFMTLMAAYQVLLHRYSGQDDILVGTPIANRSLPDIEPLIGFFANMIVIRADLSGDPTFVELLRRVRETALSAYAHQDLPFDRLVEEIQPERDLGRQPLFQVAFVLQNTPSEAIELPGLILSPIESHSGTSRFDLTFIVQESGHGLEVTAEYDADLFEAETIRRMLGHFEALLRGITANPSARLSDLPLLTEEEIRSLREDASSLEAAPDGGSCVHRVFEARAALTQDAPAVTFEGETLTYGEVNRRANVLARSLRESGVGPETLVGLCLERSLDMIVAILAILKAGGAYVPLDPAYPRERLTLILEDSSAPVILTSGGLLDRLPPYAGRILLVDADGREPADGDGSNLDAPVLPANPAYVIYTSGSTGRPKGVPVTHANIVRLFDRTDPWFGFGASDVWTLFHSVAFDFSVWEIWGALCRGGRVVVVPYWVSRSPDAFLDLIVRERVTILNQTPSAFRQLVQADEAAGGRGCPSLRLVIFGGEALELRTLRGWIDRHGDDRPQLVNMYGITETTVHVTYRRIRSIDLDSAPGSVIGGTIPDLRLHILDRRLRPLPAGLPGEICVGGAGVARGYLNLPGLTAERFVPDPFSGVPGARLYRSGDLARRLPGGDIEYLGRIDHQVKVRGFRIELGEIEAHLDSHPDVRASVAVSTDEGAGEKRIVAYFVPKAPGAPAVEDLRAWLRARLPDYMVPSALVELSALPLTAHGKIDRSALPAPDRSRPEGLREHVTPRTRAEETLAGIWSKVLGVQTVGIDDNYFDLGGDSIRSIQVRALARKAGMEIPLERLFKHQTIRDLVEALGANRDESRVDSRTAPFGLIDAGDRRLLPEDAEDAYPLSHLQTGMVYHGEYSPDYLVYVTSLHLKTRLDVEKLQSAADVMARRHPMLRTSFDLVRFAEPMQIVHGGASIRLDVQDIGHLDPNGQDRWIDDWVQAESARRFDWSKAPLLRMTVHRRSDEAFQFSLTEPFLDGWSVATLLTEMFEEYFALLEGAPPPPRPPLSSSYRDFVALERQAHASEESRRWWRERLAGAEACRLPRTARPAARGPAPAVPRIDVPLSDELSNSLKALARSAGVSIKSVLLAAHLKVIGAVTGRREVVTGLMVNGRPETDDGEKILGAFLNTVPLRFELTPGDWKRLARRAFEAESELLPHRRFTIQELERSFGGESLFDTAFNFTHFHVYRRVQDLDRAEVLGGAGSEQTYYALTAHFNVDSESSSIGLTLDYRSAEMDSSQVETLAGYYLSVLEEMARRPGGRQERHCVLPASERERLLTVWSGARSQAAQEACVHDLFERQVERTPAAVAVVEGGVGITYEALSARARALARRLRSMGVARESRVGILSDRSAETIVAVLAVLEAGGAYVPLDPDYPLERLAWMIRDAGVSVLLSRRRLGERVPEGAPPVCFLDEPAEETPARTERRAGEVSPSNLAYIIYTSGSTGVPKGVLIQHHGVANVIEASIRAFRAGPGSRILQAASLSFDASVLEILTALLSGGSLHLVDQDTLRSPTALSRLLVDERITTIMVTPSLLDTIPEGEYPDLRSVCVGGEACPAGTMERWSKGRRLFNAYAPTEATIYATLQEMEGAPEGPPAIGRPIDGSRAYVLDPFLMPAPIGTAGEIYLGGAGVARGYHGRPDLTAERFLPDPFSGEPGARIYRTGDLGRFRSDGSLQFLGRVDQQVKIRGFRIEPAEIESAIQAHPAVREAAVVAREDSTGGKRLVAYVTSAGNETPAAADLRAFLSLKIPEPMIPSAFVVLERMPRTAHGKIDRAALPAASGTRPEIDAPYVAPRTPIEELIAATWASLLGVDRVGVHDDFFQLGGHSILATQIVSRLREALRVEVPIRRLFESPTVEAMAAFAEEAIARTTGLRAPPIVRGPGEPSQPLSFSQQRLWFLQQLAPGSSIYNIPAALRLRGRLEVEALRRSLIEITRRHEILRASFPSIDGRPLQTPGPVPALLLTVESVPGESAPDREASALRSAQEESGAPFVLGAGPLLRARLLRLGEADHVLLLTMHHLVTDGWSVGVFVRELATLYGAFAEGRPSPLPEPAVQYSDFARWQREWLSGEILEKQIAYWRERLAGAPPLIDLPLDRPRPPVQTFNGAELAFDLSEDLTSKLKALCRREGVTLFMGLLSTWAALLARWSGQDDVVIGVPVAGRSHLGTEDLIGFFVNTLVVRVDLSGCPSTRGVLRRVRDSALGAWAHQDLPFDQLVEAIQPKRDVSHSPIFQVMFDFQNMPVHDLSLPGLSLDPMPIEGRTSQFDLSLSMSERDGRIGGAFQYNTDLFDPVTVGRMAGHLRTLLEASLAEPDRPVVDLEMLTHSESEEIARNGVGPRIVVRKDRGVHDLFRERAAMSPGATAVILGEERISYGELDRRSSAIASAIGRHGVGAESRVGVLADRSIETVASILGILKAGAAYVPLDPAYPSERLALVARDARVSVLLARAGSEGRLPECGAGVLVTDPAMLPMAGDPDASAPARSRPEDLAYVIYTSGSTGTPRGVLVTHESLLHSTLARRHVYESSPGRYLLLSSFAFDSSVAGLFWTLVEGGALVLPEPGVEADLLSLPGLIRRHQVTHLLGIPSLYALILREALPPDLESLRTVIVAGESCPTELVAAHHASLPGVPLLNEYGPTEGTVWCTVHRCLPGEARRSVPIGRPIPNARIHLLDRRLRPVPPGVPGEICIGGPGVARGYHGHPDRTAERFVPDPFGGAAGSRLYRTGDAARWMPDGAIEFLGRVDHQVKIRGFRVEPEEIETVIRTHPAVRDAVVVPFGDAPGDLRLAAYVLPDQHPFPLPERIKDHVRSRLPDYMVPSFIVALDAFPLTPNGKVDRRALPAPDRQGSDRPGVDRESTPLEELIAGIWSEVLELEHVGPADDFFDLGGHSLLATQVVSRIRDALQVEIPLRLIFEETTVSGLAGLILEELPEDRTRIEETARLLVSTAHLSDEELEGMLSGKDGEPGETAAG